MLQDITIRVGGSFSRQNYRQGAGTANQNDRDLNSYQGLLRVGYNLSPRINTFVQGTYIYRDYDSSRDSDGFKQNSEIYGGAVGVDVNFTDLLFGEAFVGFAHQEFDENDFSSESGGTYGLGLTWLPTQLTTVSLTGTGGFQPTSNQGASTNLQHTVGLRVEHELLRQVVLGARAGYQRDEFENINRTDDRLDLDADVAYLINRNFSIGAGYNFSKRWSDDFNREFEGNIFTVRLQAQL
ncbi:MAG: outer membrane beta-barrel protein [Pseudomonadota bacterium]